MSSRRAAHARRQASVDYPRYPPANSLTQQPPPQTLQAPPISDYESDNPGYVSDIPIHAPPPARTIEELNISVLQRHNPQITRIMSIVAYAVIYEFSPIPEPTWSKSGVEGSMFICQLTPGLYGEDRYNVIVLNRRGLNNFEVELREAEEGGVEISDPYVIISCKEQHTQKIYGVFIFSEGSGSSTEQQRADNANLMKMLAVSAGTSRKAAEVAAAHAVAQHHDGHLQEAVESLDNLTAPEPHHSFSQLSGQSREFHGVTSEIYHHEQSQDQHNQLTHPQEHLVGHHDSYQYRPRPEQPDVLGDLFRRAGLK